MKIGDLSIPGPGYALFVDAQIDMPTDDLSGNTDTTDRADRGVKPKKLMVTFSLRHNKAEYQYMTEFIALAEAKDSKGEAIVYTVVHPLAQAMRIRQMRFSATLNIVKDDILKKWDLTFVLEEFRSVPEKLAAQNQVRYVADPAESFESEMQKIEAQTGG